MAARRPVVEVTVRPREEEDKSMSTHPSETNLALLAGGDCGWLQRFFLNRHVARCGDCRDTLASFTELRSETLELASNNASIMPETDWNRLAGEMRANIRLGLAAGECVGVAPAAILPVSWKPRLAMGAACVLLLTGAGIFLHGLLPNDNPAGVVHAAARVESNSTGVQVTTGASSMTLMNNAGVAGDQTVSSDGAIRASYVDGDTGTVTVTSVYVE
jgi:predicted anti-sigma-YlaC factor YlaD